MSFLPPKIALLSQILNEYIKSPFKGAWLCKDLTEGVIKETRFTDTKFVEMFNEHAYEFRRREDGIHLRNYSSTVDILIESSGEISAGDIRGSQNPHKGIFFYSTAIRHTLSSVDDVTAYAPIAKSNMTLNTLYVSFLMHVAEWMKSVEVTYIPKVMTFDFNPSISELITTGRISADIRCAFGNGVIVGKYKHSPAYTPITLGCVGNGNLVAGTFSIKNGKASLEYIAIPRELSRCLLSIRKTYHSYSSKAKYREDFSAVCHFIGKMVMYDGDAEKEVLDYTYRYKSIFECPQKVKDIVTLAFGIFYGKLECDEGDNEIVYTFGRSDGVDIDSKVTVHADDFGQSRYMIEYIDYWEPSDPQTSSSVEECEEECESEEENEKDAEECEYKEEWFIPILRMAAFENPSSEIIKRIRTILFEKTLEIRRETRFELIDKPLILEITKILQENSAPIVAVKKIEMYILEKIL